MQCGCTYSSEGGNIGTRRGGFRGLCEEENKGLFIALAIITKLFRDNI